MAAPRRPRAPRRGRPPRAPAAKTARGEWITTALSVGGGELLDAAEEVADGARELASWSKSIPPNIRTEQHDANHVDIVCDAPPAYPAEVRSRHPLFGNREHWYGPPGTPFLRPAADKRADDAMKAYAQKIPRLVGP
jgi:hypothetical protein